MSRPKNERAKSRVGQVHLCAMCVDQADNFGRRLRPGEEGHLDGRDPSGKRHLRASWAAGPRTWFCRECFNATCAADSIFRDRNAHLELQQPEWRHDPATERQIAHLANLLDKRTVPEELREEITRPRPDRHQGRRQPLGEHHRDARWRPRRREQRAGLSRARRSISTSTWSESTTRGCPMTRFTDRTRPPGPPEVGDLHRAAQWP